MQNVSTSRREDWALIKAWGRSVYIDQARVGTVHRGAKGWIAEGENGRVLGSYSSEQTAVRAVLRAGAPR